MASFVDVMGALCLLALPIVAIVCVVLRLKQRPSFKYWSVATGLCAFMVVLWFSTVLTHSTGKTVAKNTDNKDTATVSGEQLNDTMSVEAVESDTTEQNVAEPSVSEGDVVDTSVSFDDIYIAYKENELRADDAYQYKRYRITAQIDGMETGGLLNLTGGATLTMEKQVGNTIVFFLAEFEKDQENVLKQVNVGDTVTFDGKCLSAGNWSECQIVG